MRAEELRIGNLVRVNGLKNYKTVSEITQKYLELEESLVPLKYFEVSPIPLTEEWLLKFGFEAGNRWYVLGELEVEFKNERLYVSFFGLELTVIDYVHELQNLYFALTGEELEIK